MVNPLTDELEVPMLRPGSDFCMAFVENGKHVWYVGRVHLLKRRRATGSTVLLTEPVSLEVLPTDVLVSAAWYGAADSTRTRFRYDPSPDPEYYSLEHFIGQPRLMYDPNQDAFTLDSPEEQLAALDAALADTAPYKKGSTRTAGEKKQAEQKKREREAPDWDVPAAKQPRKEPTDRAAAKQAQVGKAEGKRPAVAPAAAGKRSAAAPAAARPTTKRK